MDVLSSADFNDTIIAEFRSRGGSVTGPLADLPLILVHHVGARSGTERVVPLVYFALVDGRWLIIASNGGSHTHPAWYYNVRSNPKVTVELGTETFQVIARELHGAWRSLVWPTIVEQSPAAGQFQRGTFRTIPVFMLTRESNESEEKCATC
jgi:deazaflavin-dependent oxidoreductase (nitroreductase family)